MKKHKHKLVAPRHVPVWHWCINWHKEFNLTTHRCSVCGSEVIIPETRGRVSQYGNRAASSAAKIRQAQEV